MRLPRQHQKNRLKDILGILSMMQQMQGQSQHHRPMPAQQLSERVMVALLHEGSEQVALRRLTATLVGNQALNGSEERWWRVSVHDRILTRRAKAILST
jgi:hypothetical protein